MSGHKYDYWSNIDFYNSIDHWYWFDYFNNIGWNKLYPNKVLHKIIISKHDKYRKQFEKDQQIIEAFDKLYRKSSQDNLIGKNGNESLCNIFTKNLEETKYESFL